MNKHGKVIDEFPTEFEYEENEIIFSNGGKCKCRSVIKEPEMNIYTFIYGCGQLW